MIYHRKCIDSDEFKSSTSICSLDEIKAGAIKHFQGQADADTCKMMTGTTNVNVADKSFQAAFPGAICCNYNGCNVAPGQAKVITDGVFPTKID